MENLKYWDGRKYSRPRNHPIYKHRLGVMRKTMPLPELFVSPKWFFFVSGEVQGKIRQRTDLVNCFEAIEQQ